MTLRQMLISVLTQRGESMSYRDITDTLWMAFPEHRNRMIELYKTEKEARPQERIRLGMLVKENPGVFTATMSEGIVLVGLAATDVDDVEDADEETNPDEQSESPSVYWYTFAAYQKASNDPYPIKIGRGNNPRSRISQQVTAMPEEPTILGTYQHDNSLVLERALHSVLTLRGRRKLDAPGSEWFLTTPEEIASLIKLILSESK